MLTLIAVLYALLIFPVFITIKLSYLSDAKRVFFSLKVFSILIIKGYVEKIFDGFIIHISNRKAIYIPFSNILGMKNKIKPLKDFHLIKFRTLIESGNKDNSFFSLSCALFADFISRVACEAIEENKPYTHFRNDFSVYLDKNIFNVFVSGTVVLNLLMILVSIIKIITEKIIYAISKRKQQT